MPNPYIMKIIAAEYEGDINDSRQIAAEEDICE